MQKITFLKDAEGFSAGDIAEVKYNVAYRLINEGFAKRFSYSDKMMTATPRKEKKGYRVKQYGRFSKL